MRERPILFSGPMVRALLAGTKTQTRRMVRDQDPFDDFQSLPPLGLVCPYGVHGDRLWVRETWTDGYPGTADTVLYRATYEGRADHVWRPSIFMRRPASRITLEVSSVRVERLQDITDEDIRAEGVTPEIASEMAGHPIHDPCSLRRAWEIGWDGINGKRAPWASNPWIWALTFKRVPS